MKYFLYLLFFVLLTGCGKPEQHSGGGKPSVFVSIPPQAGLLKALVGNQVEVYTLVGDGQSPHAYEPTARQLANLGTADLFFSIGVPFETALLNKIRPLYPDLNIVASDSGIIKRSISHHTHGEHCDHDHGANDPHVWLSAKNAVSIAGNMYTALAQNDPEKEPFYRKNLEILTEELNALRRETHVLLAPFKGQRFYVYHPSFGYFADEYGLEEMPIELDGKSPSPRQLATLIEQARVDNVKIVFVQKQFPADSAQAIADAIGGTVVPLDPLAEDVIANLRQIAESIALALEK